MASTHFPYAPAQPLDLVFLPASGQVVEIRIEADGHPPRESRVDGGRRITLRETGLTRVVVHVRVLGGSGPLKVQIEQPDEVAVRLLDGPEGSDQVLEIVLVPESANRKASPTSPAKLFDVAAETPPDDAEYVVWYGTNRAPLDPDDPTKGFSANLADQVRYGRCTVLVPRSHKIGSTGSVWWKQLLTGTDDRLKLLATELLAEGTFWEGVRHQLGATEAGDAVVFVHGYNTSFEYAALRTAQIGFDLQIRGPMAFFSWPSAAKPSAYPRDENTIDASEAAIAEFVLGFAERSEAARVHVIAHSMGTRGLNFAIQRMQHDPSQRNRAKLGEIVLAAGDLDAAKFASLAQVYVEGCRRTTLYVSSRDRAVEASQWLHGGLPRVGIHPPVAVHAGIDTVSVTNADLTALGHGYVASSRDVLTDLHAVLAGHPIQTRMGLRSVMSDPGAYWIIGA